MGGCDGKLQCGRQEHSRGPGYVGGVGIFTISGTLLGCPRAVTAQEHQVCSKSGHLEGRVLPSWRDASRAGCHPSGPGEGLPVSAGGWTR